MQLAIDRVAMRVGSRASSFTERMSGNCPGRVHRRPPYPGHLASFQHPISPTSWLMFILQDWLTSLKTAG